MLSAKIIILEYICPALGVVMANIMFAAPLLDLRKAVDRGELGDLNPTPWAFMLGNCLGWVTYGILLQNLWIFFGNCPGFVMSVWLNLGAVKLLYQRHHDAEMRKSVVNMLVGEERQLTQSLRNSSLNALDTTGSEHDEEAEGVNPNTFRDENQSKDEEIQPRSTADWAKIVVDVTSQKTPAPAPHENLVMSITLIWVICISLTCFIPSYGQRAKELTVASLVNLNLVFFYGAPLSTIHAVLKEKNTSSIHIPTMITNTLNGSFWTAYGLAVSDYFIAVPNGLGTIFGVIQIFLCFVFPRQKSDGSKDEKTDTQKTTDGAKFPLSLAE